MRLEWKEQKKDSNTMVEKEKNIFNNNIEKSNSEKSSNDEKNKESVIVDVEDYFQQDFVDGELTFVCRICVEGLDTEIEIKNHINDKRESLWSDDLSDTQLYEGFDEDCNRI